MSNPKLKWSEERKAKWRATLAKIKKKNGSTWTPERTAQFRATMAAKAAAKAQANSPPTEIPLDAIPERRVPAVKLQAGGAARSKLQAAPRLAYSVSQDAFFVVVGKRRFPFEFTE
jgi:hypothetical protein